MALTKVSTGVVDMSQDTGGLVIAKGTTAQQPTCDASTLGSIRENTTENKVEVCTSTGWQFLEEAGTVLPSLNVDYLVVAGGGSGGSRNGANGSGSGGGGAGGLLTSFGNNSGGGASSGNTLTLSTSTNYTVTVGLGGAGVSSPPNTYSLGNNGQDSVFSTITSTGGGAGASGTLNASAGGSGGGAGFLGTGGSRISSPIQGYEGASSTNQGNPYPAAGGGGAGSPGTSPAGSTPGSGGVGLSVSITGNSVTYAAGGDGCIWTSGGSSNATANTGNGSDGAATAPSGSGGSGVVILRYPDAYSTTKTGLTSSVDSTTVPGFKIETFLSGTGTITFA